MNTILICYLITGCFTWLFFEKVNSMEDKHKTKFIFMVTLLLWPLAWTVFIKSFIEEVKKGWKKH